MLNTPVKRRRQNGFSAIELIIVVLVIAIIAVFAWPRIMSPRHLVQLTGIQKQLTASLRDARQEAVSQKTIITFRYDNVNKIGVIWGGNFGKIGDSRNRAVPFLTEGLKSDDVVYGRPSGAPVSALDDGATLTDLTNNIVEITFQPDGSLVNAGSEPQNKAMYFYNPQAPAETSFAVSILAVGGRTKFWRYNQGTNTYTE